MLAVIFDMDGVIADTEKLHAQTSEELLRDDYGLHIPSHELSAVYAGTDDGFMFADLFQKHHVKGDPEEASKKRWQRMYDVLGGNIRPMPGFFPLFEQLKRNGNKIAVASGSFINFIDLVLDSLKIKDQFHAIASSEEVPYPKPAPDVFLLAAKRLGVEPHDCVVIEDGINGMRGAKQAGMKVVALVEDTTKDWPADLVVNSLKKLDVAQLQRLVS
jgi:HAD superfamily hydrolase (TIGR01509 family)